MQAATIELLMQKGKFEPPVAVTIAEAINMAMNNSPFVTIPILDARFVAFGAKFDERFARFDERFAAFEVKLVGVKAELMRWVLLVMVANVALGAGTTAIVNALQNGP
jgi:hypothetical protein